MVKTLRMSQPQHPLPQETNCTNTWVEFKVILGLFATNPANPDPHDPMDPWRDAHVAARRGAANTPEIAHAWGWR